MSKKQLILEINPEIRTIFNSKGIPIHDGVAYLLCLHYGLSPSYIPEELSRKILATNIVTKDYSSDTIKWNINLFEEQCKKDKKEGLFATDEFINFYIVEIILA